MRKYTIILFLIFISSSGFAQNPHASKSIDELVKEIVAGNELMSQAIGIGGSSNDQYERYAALKAKANREQLILLTKHENAVVRCYAFWGLADREEKELFPILMDHLTDTTIVNRQFGCVSSEVSVADFYIELLTKRYLITEDYYRKNHSQVLIEEKQKLDSTILYTPNSLTYLDKILWDYEPVEKDYERIRAIVQGGNYVGLRALARYQNQQDTGLILSFKDFKPADDEAFNFYRYRGPHECMLLAMEIFPDKHFIPYLEEYGRENLTQEQYGGNLRELYRLGIKYNTKQFLNLLSTALTWKVKTYQEKYRQRSHIETLAVALGEYPTKENQYLIVKLWKEHLEVGEGGFNYLKEQDVQLTFELVQMHMKDFKKSYAISDNSEVLNMFIPFLLDYDKEVAIQLIAKNLKLTSIAPFENLASFAKSLKHESFIEPLFYRLAHDSNRRVVFEAIDLILTYERKDLNNSIIPTLKKNKKLYNKDYSMEEALKKAAKRIKNYGKEKK